jgi:protein-S-isoprenylcysteine O-methyltransferase Ste14
LSIVCFDFAYALISASHPERVFRVPPDDSAATPSAPSRKPTGPLKAPTGSLKLPTSEEQRQATLRPARRDFTVRLAELVILLTAIVGAVALGLGISAYFAAHRYVEVYLVAYATFRFADLLVRDEAALGIDSVRFGRRVMNELPLLALFFSAPFERSWSEGSAPRWLAALGVLIELAGLWIVLGARIQLGFFSPPHAAGARPALVRDGLYRYVRHPVYLGEFLVVLAWPFEYAAPFTLLLALIVGILILRVRIRDEEGDMLAMFGDEYAAYRRQTYSLLPNVW